ncbi:MAG: FGGY-family carbohydrate kinase, partial [Spirochaetota bacterium]
VEHKTLICGYSAAPGLWHPYAYINGGGMNLEWFRKELVEKAIGEKRIDFEELNKAADELPASETDPYFIPHLGGRVCPGKPDLRGAWLQLSWNHTIGHLYKAVLEGVALEYKVYTNILGRLYESFKPRAIRVTGGGGRSILWNRLKADVLGIPVEVVSRSEGAPLGSALLAGYGAGIFPDLSAAADTWINTLTEVKPDTAKARLYEKRVARYELYMSAINRINSGSHQGK